MSDTKSDTTQRWLTNAQMRDALVVIEELLRHTGRTAVLRLSGLERYIDQLPPNNDRPDVPRGDLTAMFAGVVSMFGEQGARGVLRRWGRAFAVRRIQSRARLRVLRLGLRVAPPERAALATLARLLHHVDLARAQPPSVDDRGEYLFVELTDCLYGSASNAPATYPAVVGMLEGILRWATGRDYEVREDPPVESGRPIFKIRKRPLGNR